MHMFILCIISSFHFVPIICSPGDRSIVYQNCLKNCVNANCIDTGKSFKITSEIQQDEWFKLSRWSCSDECKYMCMWRTVKAFKESMGIVPKFHGKWPFVRMYGAQEPASAICSILNLAANAYMYSKLRVLFPTKTRFGLDPLVLFWHIFAIICMNAWVWSTIFHIKDTMFTEFMDYTCALSMVVALFVAAVVRVFHGRNKLILLILAYPLCYFVKHVTYLYTGIVDYDFNMKVNIFYGVAGSVIWLIWSSQQCLAGSTHTRPLLVFTALSGVTLGLELFDFPPLGATWDAHALWHLSTAPLPLLFYKFVIDDLKKMQYKRSEKIPMKLP